jgi:hypothetical protein
MKWVEAVKIWNHGKRTVNTSHGWFVPKSGTKEYDEVREIMKMEKTKEHDEILSKKSERTIAKKARKEAKKRGEKIPRKRKEKKEEPKFVEEPKMDVEAIKAEVKGRNEERNKKALEQLRMFEKQISESNLEKAKKAEAMAKVAAARESIEKSVKPIRSDKVKGGFRGQFIQAQRSKYVKLLDDIEFFLFNENSPLRNREVLKEFGKDKMKKKAIKDKFRIFMNLEEMTKDKVILERKKKIEERKAADPKAKTVPVDKVEDKVLLEKAVKDVFDGDAPKMMEKKIEPVMDKEEDNIVMKKEDYVKEHKELINVLESAGKEGEKQKAEVKAVLKEDLPPPALVNKSAHENVKDKIEDNVEIFLDKARHIDEPMIVREVAKMIASADYYASKFKALGKKQRDKQLEAVMTLHYVLRPENKAKLEKAFPDLYDMVKDTKIDKEWMEYAKKK